MIPAALHHTILTNLVFQSHSLSHTMFYERCPLAMTRKVKWVMNTPLLLGSFNRN